MFCAEGFTVFDLFFANKTTTRTCYFEPLIVKMILIELRLTFSIPTAAKTQYFVHLSFNSTFQLIIGIVSNH